MLLEKIKSDMIQAMKDKDAKRKIFLQVVLGEIETESKRVKGEFIDAKIEEMLFKMKKRTEDSLELYKTQNREDLLNKAEMEIHILQEYLPEQLTEMSINSIVASLIEDLEIDGMKDRGKLMKALMPKVKGKADGNLVNKIVEKFLK